MLLAHDTEVALNAAAAEALTSVLIFLNKEYGTHSGIRITGVGDPEGA